MRLCIFLFLVPFYLSAQQLHLVDQTNIKNKFFDVYGYTNPKTNEKFAILGSQTQTYIYYVNQNGELNPASTISGIGFDFKTWKNYLYIVNGSTFGGKEGAIYDITDPYKPVFMDSLETAHNILITDYGLLIASCPGIKIYDLNENPLKPKLLWYDGDDGSNCHDIIVKDSILYDFHGYYGTRFYNISNPDSPQLLGSILDTNIVFNHSGAVNNDHSILYISDEFNKIDQDDITIWDIKDKANPLKIGGFQDQNATSHNIYLRDSIAITSYYKSGIRLFKILPSGLLDPIENFYTDTVPDTSPEFSGCFGVYIDDNYIYASDLSNGLFVFYHDILNGVFSDISLNTVLTNDIGQIQKIYLILPNGQTLNEINQINPDTEFQILEIIKSVPSNQLLIIKIVGENGILNYKILKE